MVENDQIIFVVLINKLDKIQGIIHSHDPAS